MTSSIGSYYTGQRTGVSGLATGLDTDSIVESMTYYTRNRINDVLRDTQTIQWEMDAYQSISSKINDFAYDYTSYSSSTNLLSNSFFSSSEITTTGTNSKYISATGSSNLLESFAVTGVQQVATAASYLSSSSLSQNKITTGSLDFTDKGKTYNNFSGMTINVTYDSNTYAVTLAEGIDPSSAQEVADAFNAAAAEVELSDGTKLSDNITLGVNANKLEFAKTDTNDSSTFKIAGASDSKALAAMGFKVGAQMASSGDKLTGETEVDPANFSTSLNFNDTLKGNALTFNLNGLTKNIVFDDSINFASIGEFNTYLQDKLNDTFGTVGTTTDAEGNTVPLGRVQATVVGDTIEFQVMKSDGNVDAYSKLSMSSTNSNIVSEKGIFGIDNGTTNKVNIHESLKDGPMNLTFDAEGKGSLMINDVVIEYSENDSIDTIIDRINDSDAGVTVTYMETSDTFSIVADDKGAQGRIELSDVGSSTFVSELFGGAITADDIIKGQDSIITVKYDNMPGEQTLIRSSDSFEVDGVTLTLSADATNFVAGEEVRFTSEPKTDEIVDAITKMVEDYNEIVDLVNSAYTTKPDNDYYPLTDEEKAEMSDREIELWEERAQQGILFGDSDLSSLASDLRFMFSFPVDGAMSLEDMGITVSSSYSDNGKVSIDVQKLENAIESDIEGVKAAFTAAPEAGQTATQQNEIGFMQRFDNIVTKYTNTVGYDKGILIQKAGEADAISEKDSILQQQIDDLKSQYDDLLYRLEMEEDRYYAQFTALEVYTQQMNSQSSWLSSFGVTGT